MEIVDAQTISFMDIVRYKGKWFKIEAKPYEPEKQTFTVAWSQIREPVVAQEAYKTYFEKQRKEAKVLYPSFRKDE
jgi:lipocalin